MKALFFDAVAAQRSTAPALQRQAEAALEPFARFLEQAIHTARHRQSRYQLAWAKVRDARRVELEPLDVSLRLPRRRPGWLVTSWPADREPVSGHPLMIVNRGVVVEVLGWRRHERGLRLSLGGDLREGDQVFWCGRSCLIEPEPEPSAPGLVASTSGEPVRPRSAAAEGDHWRLVIEGSDAPSELLIDGERVEVERVSPFEGLRRLRDAQGTSFESSGEQLSVGSLPADGPMTGDNGVRFRWKVKGTPERNGSWVQLLLPDALDADEDFDPRAAFCEDNVSEVWTQPRRRDAVVLRVMRVDSDRCRLLLDWLPPEGTRLFLPVDVRNLQLQRRAVRQLAEAPLPHHQGLLRLCEDPQRASWPRAEPRWPSQWHSLTDASRDGTDEQRRFVAKALGTLDLAILEGPPGSGKTTAICELVQQLVADGKRVLLCASTHVAIDNVLERLLTSQAPVDAVRIGRLERVDEKVASTQLDQRVGALKAAWRSLPHLAGMGEDALSAMAERTIMMAANLTCGTTMGIVNHPVFRDRDRDQPPWERPIAAMPQWDVLIVDEASKTLVQELLVPALMAKRWVIVGDIHQLPPFADRADIVANLRSLVDRGGREVFPPNHQRACLLLFRLSRPELCRAGARWLVVEAPGVLDHLTAELEAREGAQISVVRVVRRRSARAGAVAEVTVEQVIGGQLEALRLAEARWVLVGDDLLHEVAPQLPADLLQLRDVTRGERGLPESHPLLFRSAWSRARASSLQSPYRERGETISTASHAEEHERRWAAEHDLAGELAWRLTRAHELRHSRDAQQRERLRRGLSDLKPRTVDIGSHLADVGDVGLPSVLEVLQQGIGEERAKRPCALAEGLPRRGARSLQERFESLSFQHRMHPDIARFPRELVYDGASLRDANTIAQRDVSLGWGFAPFASRRAWVDARGREQGGVNADEVEVLEAVLREFLAWASRKGPPARSSPRVWEVACLSFYTRQERAISRMLQALTDDGREGRFSAPHVEIVCGTVDRFQGREADLVLLSMRNTRRVGFLDSPNRRTSPSLGPASSSWWSAMQPTSSAAAWPSSSSS